MMPTEHQRRHNTIATHRIYKYLCEVMPHACVATTPAAQAPFDMIQEQRDNALHAISISSPRRFPLAQTKNLLSIL